MLSFFIRTMGGVSVCRGIQVADYLGAKLNPTDGYENDVCIYVKKTPRNGYEFPKHSYLDIADSPRAGRWLLTHPNIGIISISKFQCVVFSKILGRSDLILIPHHHCNYDREKRVDREVKTVGVIGATHAFNYDSEAAKGKFREHGLDFIYETYCGSRMDAVNFYKKIDIQVVWRPQRNARKLNPLKLSNAGSFGIPTVAFPEKDFVSEWDGCFIPAQSIEDLIEQVCKLKNDKMYYDDVANKAMVRAEDYHIENISRLYLELESRC